MIYTWLNKFNFNVFQFFATGPRGAVYGNDSKKNTMLYVDPHSPEFTLRHENKAGVSRRFFDSEPVWSNYNKYEDVSETMQQLQKLNENAKKQYQ